LRRSPYAELEATTAWVGAKCFGGIWILNQVQNDEVRHSKWRGLGFGVWGLGFGVWGNEHSVRNDGQLRLAAGRKPSCRTWSGIWWA